MSLREFGFYISEAIKVIVINSQGLAIALYDGKESIPEDILDRNVVKITSAQLGTIWIEVKTL